MFSAENMVNYILADEDPVALKKAIDALKNEEVFIVGFSGKKGSGKDTMAEIFASSFEKDYGPVNFSPFGDYLKGEATAILGFFSAHMSTPASLRPSEEEMLARLATLFNITEDEAKSLYESVAHEMASNRLLDGWTRTPGVWKMLRLLGTDIRQPQDKIYWVRRAVHNIIVNANNGISTIVQDTRFLHEVEALKNMGAYVARVDIDPEVQLRRISGRDKVKATADATSHPSETALDDYPDFDIRVDNSADGKQQEIAEAVYADWREKRS